MSQGVNILCDMDGKYPPTGTMIVTSAKAVTTHNTNTINPTVGLWIGAAGDVAVTMADGQDVVFKAASPGRLNISVIRVKTTGTTATDIVALYP